MPRILDFKDDFNILVAAVKDKRFIFYLDTGMVICGILVKFI
jgi:hypothetical protein